MSSSAPEPGRQQCLVNRKVPPGGRGQGIGLRDMLVTCLSEWPPAVPLEQFAQ